MHNFFLIFTLLFLLISTQYAYSHSIVEFLPGFEGRLPFKLETGYVGVGESEDVQLFYYFVESETNPQNDPLIIWLTGGPGCSGLSALAYEIGPFSFNTTSDSWEFPSLLLNDYSWTKMANIIFLDSPVHTGFSYATTTNAGQCTDIQACQYVHQFLLKWLIDHPQFISNQFYVGGDSYSGIVVPAVTQIVSQGIEAGVKPVINLKGYILGNPGTTLTGIHSDYNSRIPFFHGVGFISSELYESLRKHCKGEYFNIDPNNAPCNRDVQTYNELVRRINGYHILEPLCVVNPQCDVNYIKQHEVFDKRRSLDDISTKPSKVLRCREDELMLANNWANKPKVQEALHVRKDTITEWLRCNRHLTTYTMTIYSSMPYHKNMSIRGYRSLIYSGDHDSMIPHVGTEAWIKSLNYSIIDEWRPWIVHDDQVAGYTRTYANKMTFATVKGAGHTAPSYKPRDCFDMFKRWISYEPL